MMRDRPAGLNASDGMVLHGHHRNQNLSPPPRRNPQASAKKAPRYSPFAACSNRRPKSRGERQKLVEEKTSMFSTLAAMYEMIYDRCDGECGEDDLSYAYGNSSKSSLASTDEDGNETLDESTLNNSTIQSDTLMFKDWKPNPDGSDPFLTRYAGESRSDVYGAGREPNWDHLDVYDDSPRDLMPLDETPYKDEWKSNVNSPPSSPMRIIGQSVLESDPEVMNIPLKAAACEKGNNPRSLRDRSESPGRHSVRRCRSAKSSRYKAAGPNSAKPRYHSRSSSMKRSKSLTRVSNQKRDDGADQCSPIKAGRSRSVSQRQRGETSRPRSKGPYRPDMTVASQKSLRSKQARSLKSCSRRSYRSRQSPR
jgi:hypothetical protein